MLKRLLSLDKKVSALKDGFRLEGDFYSLVAQSDSFFTQLIEYQALLLQLVKNPASLVNSEQEAQLQQTQQELAKCRKSELNWQRECQTLVDKLDQEVVQKKNNIYLWNTLNN